MEIYIFPYVPYCIRYPDVDTFSSQKEKFIDQKKYNDLYIITYANKVFFNRLKNFVGSVHYWEPELRIIVYDLGMCKSQIEDIKRWKNTQVFHFNFSLYPPHVKSLYKYAWKLIILNETFHKYENIFLEDSGQEFRNKIDPIRKRIREEGFFSLQTQDIAKSKKLTHPLTEEYLGIKLKIWQLSGATLGLKKQHPRKETIAKFVETAVNCALKEECIAPKGSSLRNHRYDQAVLSLLAQEYKFNCGGTDGCWVDFKGFSHPPLTMNPKEANDIVLCSRRGQGQPYAPFLVRE